MSNINRVTKTHDILSWLKQHDQLPEMPDTLHQFETLWQQPNHHLGELGKVLEADSRISTRLIEIANSVLHRGDSNSTSVAHAVHRIGMIEARNVVHAVSLHQLFYHRCIDAKQFWRHSIISAFTAKKIVEYGIRRFKWEVNKHDAFLAALLHEAGLILMFRYYKEFPLLLENCPNMERWIEAEARLFHMNHAVLGAALFKTWHLPEHIVLAIATHHHPRRLPKNKQLLSVITHLAEAATLYIGQDNGMMTVEPEQLSLTTLELLENYRISIDQLNYLGEQGREEAESSSMLRMF